ncbi:MAG TPA: hypothetical protein VNF75_09165 [Candidatus Dormibacteraeota bacterium]|nr:hypothetical protein [Candidatus Dormibacteraeota bacterium]
MRSQSASVRGFSGCSSSVLLCKLAIPFLKGLVGNGVGLRFVIVGKHGIGAVCLRQVSDGDFAHRTGPEHAVLASHGNGSRRVAGFVGMRMHRTLLFRPILGRFVFCPTLGQVVMPVPMEQDHLVDPGAILPVVMKVRM